MLDAIGAGATAKATHDWAQLSTDSNECKRVTEEIQEICKERQKSELSQFMKDQREYAMPDHGCHKANVHLILAGSRVPSWKVQLLPTPL